MTLLTEKPPVAGSETLRLRRRLRSMSTLVIVLAVALVGLGVWATYDFITESDTAVPGEIQTLLDDYRDAWNNYDDDAFLGLVTDGYRFEFAGDVTGAQDQAVAIVASETVDGHVEKVGKTIMYGDGPSYFVAQANHTTSEGVDLDGISLFTIVKDGDVFKIHRHVFVGSFE